MFFSLVFHSLRCDWCSFYTRPLFCGTQPMMASIWTIGTGSWLAWPNQTPDAHIKTHWVACSFARSLEIWSEFVPHSDGHLATEGGGERWKCQPASSRHCRTWDGRRVGKSQAPPFGNCWWISDAAPLWSVIKLKWQLRVAVLFVCNRLSFNSPREKPGTRFLR